MRRALWRSLWHLHCINSFKQEGDLSAVESVFLELQISAMGMSSWAGLRGQASSMTATTYSWSLPELYLTSMAGYFEQMWTLFQRDLQPKWCGVTAGVEAKERTLSALCELALSCSVFPSLGIAVWALHQQAGLVLSNRWAWAQSAPRETCMWITCGC